MAGLCFWFRNESRGSKPQRITSPSFAFHPCRIWSHLSSIKLSMTINRMLPFLLKLISCPIGRSTRESFNFIPIVFTFLYTIAE